MKRRRILQAVGTGFPIISVAGCANAAETVEYQTNSRPQTASPPSGRALNTDSPEKQGTPADDAEVVIQSDELARVDTGYSTEAAVRAQLENIGTRRSPYVEARAKFYDGAGNLLDSTFDNMSDLDPGEVWETYIPYFGESREVARHELSAVYDPYRSLPPAENVDLLDHSREVGEYEAFVVGRAKNTRQSPIDYLEARAKFYAKNGTVLSSNYTNITDVGAGETWKFEIAFSSYEPDGHKRVESHKVLLTDSALG